MKLKITVHGVAYEVDVEVLDPGEGFPAPSALPRPRMKSPRPDAGGPVAPPAESSAVPSGENGGSVTSPIAGTVVELKCKPGDNVSEGQILLVIEAMKMKTSIAAPTAGKVKSIPVAVGDPVRESQVLVEFV
ncbi:MAG: biotin/lipoyl-containing protein [Candidatus Zixiibacteriota bacterium]